MCSKNEVNNQTFPLDSSSFHEGCPDSLQRKDCGKQAGEGGGGGRLTPVAHGVGVEHVDAVQGFRAQYR